MAIFQMSQLQKKYMDFMPHKRSKNKKLKK